jgi:hypothetical protein
METHVAFLFGGALMSFLLCALYILETRHLTECGYDYKVVGSVYLMVAITAALFVITSLAGLLFMFLT